MTIVVELPVVGTDLIDVPGLVFDLGVNRWHEQTASNARTAGASAGDALELADLGVVDQCGTDPTPAWGRA